MYRHLRPCTNIYKIYKQFSFQIAHNSKQEKCQLHPNKSFTTNTYTIAQLHYTMHINLHHEHYTNALTIYVYNLKHPRW